MIFSTDSLLGKRDEPPFDGSNSNYSPTKLESNWTRLLLRAVQLLGISEIGSFNLLLGFVVTR